MTDQSYEREMTPTCVSGCFMDLSHRAGKVNVRLFARHAVSAIRYFNKWGWL